MQLARTGLSLVLIVVALTVGVSLAKVFVAMKEEPARRSVAAPPPVVTCAHAVRGDVPERWVGYGSAVPIRVTNVAAEVSGQVVEIPGDLRAGSPVEEGQTLAAIDARQYEAELARIQAQQDTERAQLDQLRIEESNLKKLLDISDRELRIASDEVDRLLGLLEENQAHKREYDLARLTHEQARRVWQTQQRELELLGPRRERLDASLRALEAAERIAQLNVDRCAVKAPYAAVVQQVFVERGSQVGPGTPLMRLVDPNLVEVGVRVPSSAQGRVQVGSSCTLRSETIEGNRWTGNVARIAPTVDEASRTLALYVLVDNREQSVPLVPGTFVEAVVRGAILADALLVPRTAIRDGRVFVIREEAAEAVPVEVKRYLQEYALVEADLTDGNLIALTHLDTLVNGAAVRVELSATYPENAVALQRTSPSERGLPSAPNETDAATKPDENRRTGGIDARNTTSESRHVTEGRP
jgi:RND family efflux transporter MFP subunit